MARVALILSILLSVVALLGGFRMLMNEWKAWRAKRAGRTITIIMLCLLLPSIGEAADHYIRDGGTASTSGTGSCTDWSTGNACDILPTTLVRGDTYYIADGSYVGRTFNTSGTTLISILKATVASHGTSTGWVDTYGDGQAIFQSTLTFGSSGWLFDGRTRNEGNWFDGTVYGFKIANNGNANETQIGFSSALSNFSLKYTWVEGRDGVFSGSERRYMIDMETSGLSTDLLFSHNLTTKSNQHYFLRTTGTVIIEYGALDDTLGDEFNHGDTINAYFIDGAIGDNTNEVVIVRFNQFRDIGMSSGWDGVTGPVPIAEGYGTTTPPEIWLYGNLSVRFSGGDGVFGFGGNVVSGNGGICVNCRVYNNTTVDGDMQFANGWGLMFPDGSGNIAKANLWMNGPLGVGSGNPPSFDLGTSPSHSYDAFGTNSSTVGTNAQGSIPTSIFAAYGNLNTHADYALTEATSCATAITGTAPDGGRLDIDMLGNVRGGDGCWDRGAFEYGSAPAVTPSFPMSQMIFASHILTIITGLVMAGRLSFIALRMMIQSAVVRRLSQAYAVWDGRQFTADIIRKCLPVERR